MAACSILSRSGAGGDTGREAAVCRVMDEAGLPKEPYPDGSLCHYAQKITACFGGMGKTPYALGFAEEMPLVDGADGERD